jgi:hypothetical protein
MFEKLLLGIFEVGTLFGLRLLPCATQQKGDLANRRDLCLFKDHSSSQTIQQQHHNSNDPTIDRSIKTIEVQNDRGAKR